MDDYPAREMHAAMRVLELGLRNVKVPWTKGDANQEYAVAFQRLQSRLLVLREQATSARWSPAFLQLLRQTRSVHVHGLTATHRATIANIDTDIDDDTVNYETWKAIQCCACATKKALDAPPANAIEIVGSIWKRSPRDDADFLLTCKPEKLHARIMRRFEIDEKTAEAPEVPDRFPLMPGSYLGLFVTGPTCHVLACTYVWLQNFLPNLAYLIEGHLDLMTDAETKLPVNDFSVVTEEMAVRIVKQLEAVETLLRENRAASVRPPPPLSFMPNPNGTFHKVEQDMWDRVHDAVWMASERKAVSPMGHGATNADRSAEEGWRPTEPSWYKPSTLETWCMDSYFLCLYRRACFERGRRNLIDCATVSGTNAAPVEEEEEVVILDDDDVDVIEEDDGDVTEEAEDDVIEDDEVVMTEEDENDERTQRRLRREKELAERKKPATPRRKKRRAVVDDDDDEDNDCDTTTLPASVRRMRCIDVADASKTLIHFVPGHNQVCILEYK